jgi:hypothetical protein
MQVWYEDLPAETLRRFRDRYPGLSLLREIPRRAMQHPRYAKDFEQLGVTSPEVTPISRPAMRAFQKLVVAAMLEDDEAQETIERVRGSAPYPRKAFNEAVRMLRAGEDVAEIARTTGIHRNRVTKIRDRYVFPRPGCPDYEAVAGQIAGTVILRRRT